MSVKLVTSGSGKPMVIEEPRKQLGISLSADTYSKLQEISKHVYRGVNITHAIRCSIEDIWQQWKDKEKAKENNHA